MGMRRLQFVSRRRVAEGVAELLEADHGFAAGAGSGIGEDFERAGGELDPVVGRGEDGREAADKREQRAPHALPLSRVVRVLVEWMCSSGAIV